MQNIVLILLSLLLLVSFFYIFQLIQKNKKLIQKQKNTRLALRNKVKLLSEYNRAVDVGTIVSKTNKQGIITYVNDSFCKISGYKPEELIGKPHSIVNHPDNDKAKFKDMWSKILAKKLWHGDLKNKAKNGTVYYVTATIIPILNKKNEILEFVAIRYDTTKLNSALLEAKSAKETKDEFLANMSHELRTPLNAIIGFSQVLLQKKALDAKDTSYVEKIQTSGENLLQLVNSILDFSKIEKGEMEFHPTNLNLREEIYEEIMILFELKVKEKNLTVSMTGCDGSNYIFGDKQLLQQVFINIISNAVKFTPEGGNIDFSYKLENGAHHFQVCDNGVGIEEEELELMFLPFKQTASARSNKAKGTGLGLSIAKNIIENLHHGKITVISRVGVGTCFKITL